MNFKSISFYLSLFCFPISFLAFINILYASYFDYFLSIDTYFAALITSLVLGLALLYYGKNSKYRSGLGLLSNEMTVLFSSASSSNFRQTVKKNISQSAIMQTDKIVLWFLVFNKMMMTMVYLLQ